MQLISLKSIFIYHKKYKSAWKPVNFKERVGKWVLFWEKYNT